MSTDRKDGNEETPKKTVPDKPIPAAGPHAKPELTDMERTPGAGTLPDPDEDEAGDAASS